MQSMGCHGVSEQLMAAGATEDDVKKISQVMAQTVRKLETRNAAPEPGPEAHSLPCEVVGSDEEEPVKRHHRKETIGEKCKQEGEVCSLLRLWIWTQLIAVPFHLALSRIGEAVTQDLHKPQRSWRSRRVQTNGQRAF